MKVLWNICPTCCSLGLVILFTRTLKMIESLHEKYDCKNKSKIKS